MATPTTKRTVLLGHPGASWREWLKFNRKGSQLLCLDPADPTHGQPGKFVLLRGDRPLYERFYGSLDSGRAPHVLLAALHEALAVADDELMIQLFAYRVTPLLRQTMLIALQMIRPERILIAEGCPFDVSESPFPAEVVELEKAFSPSVQNAQRKAQWLSLVERVEEHTVDLRTTILEGCRLGSGSTMDEHQKAKLNLNDAYVEVAGTSLFVVTDEEYDEEVISRAMDYTHTARVHFASPSLYEGVLCAFTKASGEDFGFGYVEHIDFVNLRAKVRCTAIPPVPVRMMRIGSLRIDERGNEHGELKPWQI